MLELLAKVEQAAVPLAFTLTYPDHFPLYREDYKGHLEAFCDRYRGLLGRNLLSLSAGNVTS
jgi:hypothetical protein